MAPAATLTDSACQVCSTRIPQEAPVSYIDGQLACPECASLAQYDAEGPEDDCS
ncbi:hypothetical protein [Streptomyces sp. NPDC017448]|uniref:hypothetical protein n=1 Tax=Streptomyces sp. NPDC017448 TaxID=3364996 RepID=UPI003795470A